MSQQHAYTVTVDGMAYMVEIECTDILPLPAQRYVPPQILEMGRPAPWIFLRRAGSKMPGNGV